MNKPHQVNAQDHVIGAGKIQTGSVKKCIYLSIREIMMMSTAGAKDLLTPSNKGGETPSEVTSTHWLFAKNGTTNNNRKPEENCGKWMIFEPYSRIDTVWSLIKEETEKGELGFASKVSTKKSKEEKNELHNSSNYVICVYTYDHEDEADAMRVRERLRKLGFQKKLPYKTDAATYAGSYRSTTGSKVSKWYC